MTDETNMRPLRQYEPLYSDDQGRLITADGFVLDTYEIPEFKASNLMQEIRLEITITKIPQLRLRLFTLLMRLAAQIGGFGSVTITEQYDPEKPE